MNHFKFYSVGQGLFYTGSLAHKTFNFVYDCGTESKQHYLCSSIDSYIREIQDDAMNTPKIEFVVISHLHKDHFSGLFELANKANIHKVYLPYLGNDKNFITLILAHIIFGNRQEKVKEQNIYPLFHFMCGLYGVENNYDISRMEVVFLGENEVGDEESEVVHSTHKDYLYIESQKYWKFVFVSRRISESKLKLLNSKMHNVLVAYGIEYIVDLISLKNGIEQIAEIYKEVFSSDIKKNSNFLNMTSIVLVHYPLYSSPIAFYADTKEIAGCAQRRVDTRYFGHWYPCDYTCFEFQKLWNPATILTGDIEIDNVMGNLISSQLKQIRDGSKSACGVLQVPHHGSKTNWKAWLKTSIDAQMYIISFGLGNCHKHPHSDTTDNLVLSQNHIQLVNQIQDFEYYID